MKAKTILILIVLLSTCISLWGASALRNQRTARLTPGLLGGGELQFDVDRQIQSAVPLGCAGDVNKDGLVDNKDLVLVQASFGKRSGQPGYNPMADMDLNGIVDIFDLSTVSRNI